MYREGKYPETPEGISTREFHRTKRKWVRIEEGAGPEALEPKVKKRVWTPEEKYELVAKVLEGRSNKSVAFESGINEGLLYQWVQRYKIEGYEGLYSKRKGRHSKEDPMKKKEISAELTTTEREEIVRLKAENERLRAENEVIKKRIALRHEQWEAQLKARKQRSSKNSEKKDIR